MHAIMQTRLAKVAPTGSRVNLMTVKPTRERVQPKKAGMRFVSILLSALSSWAA
jgi:hypothetical protein